MSILNYVVFYISCPGLECRWGCGRVGFSRVFLAVFWGIFFGIGLARGAGGHRLGGMRFFGFLRRGIGCLSGGCHPATRDRGRSSRRRCERILALRSYAHGMIMRDFLPFNYGVGMLAGAGGAVFWRGKNSRRGCIGVCAPADGWIDVTYFSIYFCFRT